MYSQFISYMLNRIYDNGNYEITPTKLQQVFQEAKDVFGEDANFMGVVTPSDTILATDVKQVFLAVPTTSARTFTNFGGSISVPAYQGCLFFYENDAWAHQLLSFEAVKQTADESSSEQLPLLFQQDKPITSGSKLDTVAYSKEMHYQPSSQILTAPKFKGDGSNLTNLPPTTPTSHDHGNIQNGGSLQTNDITVATGDKLVVTESSDSDKVARSSISFDTSNTSEFLRKDGTWATPASGGDTGYVFSALSDNASTVTFGANKGYFKVNVTGSTQTFNLAVGNACVNYLLITNSGSSDCTVALGMQGGGTWTSFVLPTDAITVPTGKSIELSFISINSHTQLVVTKSAELEVTSLS